MKKLLYLFVFIPVFSWGVNTKVTGLDAIASPITDDVLYVVDDVAGTPASKKITIGNILNVANDLNTSGDVTDDSHAHTSTTLSGIDISDDTNLTADNGATLTGDTISVSSVSLSTQVIGVLPGSKVGGGSTSYIQLTDTLQSGATFFVSSGTIDGELTIQATGKGTIRIGYVSDSPLIVMQKIDATDSAIWRIRDENGTTVAQFQSTTGGFSFTASTSVGAFAVNRMRFSDQNDGALIRVNQGFSGFDLTIASMTFDSGADDPILDWVTDNVLRVAKGTFSITDQLDLTYLILGSIPFIGAGGKIIDDNTSLFWDDATNTLIIDSSGEGLSIRDGSGNKRIFTNINGGFGEFSVANNSGVTKIFFGSGNHAYVDGINFGFKTTSPNSEVHVIGGICVESSDSNCSSPNGTVMVSVGLDAVGAVDMDYGSGDVTDHRFITDGTGNSEMVLPNDSIGPAEIDSTTGIYDFGDVTSLEIPNGSGPNVSVEGQIEITTDAYTSTGSSGTITFFSNGRIHYVVTTTGPPSDNSIAKWDSALNQWSIEADAGGGGDDTNSIRTITWAGPTLLATRPQQTGFDGIAGNFQNDGSSISVQSAAFDDSDDECRGTTFDVQRDTDTTGTVTFDVVWYSTTATSGSVQWFFSWVNYAEGESWDQLLTQESAASDAVQGTVNQVTRTSWTETMSNLGWEAGDAITGFICRDGDGSAGTDDMVDDAQILTFTIGIPRQ